MKGRLAFLNAGRTCRSSIISSRDRKILVVLCSTYAGETIGAKKDELDQLSNEEERVQPMEI